MSLINDALRKAKQAQQQEALPASTGPQLRPVDSAQYGRRGLGLLLPAGFGLVALFLLLFVWQFARNNSARNTEAHPNAPAAKPESAASQPVAAAPALARLAPPAAAAMPAAATNAPAPAEAVATVTTNQAPNGATNAAAVVAPAPPPKPAPLRLQGIFLSSTRPSAVVGGKTLFVGDRIGEFRLVALDQQTATLVSSGKTNVLVLGE